jgi:hypothetical protein
MPRMVGEINNTATKDYGKGKNAAPRKVRVVTARIEGRSGLPAGKLEFALTDEEIANREYAQDTVITINIDHPQEKLDLNQRAVDARNKPAASRAN